MPAATRRRTRIAGASALAVAGLVLAAPAVADPAPPPDPAVPLPGAELRVDPLAALGNLLTSSPQPAVVGLAPLPPDTVSNGPGADPMAFTQLLLPQNYRMPTSDQISPYPLAPNDAPSPFARIDAWKGVHALAHGGLGRMPGADLGQPLPGTAAAPGSNLPPGLEQFYVDPTLLYVDPTPPRAEPPA